MPTPPTEHMLDQPDRRLRSAARILTLHLALVICAITVFAVGTIKLPTFIVIITAGSALFVPLMTYCGLSAIYKLIVAIWSGE